MNKKIDFIKKFDDWLKNDELPFNYVIIKNNGYYYYSYRTNCYSEFVKLAKNKKDSIKLLEEKFNNEKL